MYACCREDGILPGVSEAHLWQGRSDKTNVYKVNLHYPGGTYPLTRAADNMGVDDKRRLVDAINRFLSQGTSSGAISGQTEGYQVAPVQVIGPFASCSRCDLCFFFCDITHAESDAPRRPSCSCACFGVPGRTDDSAYSYSIRRRLLCPPGGHDREFLPDLAVVSVKVFEHAVLITSFDRIWRD